MRQPDNAYGLPLEIHDAMAVREALFGDLGAADIEEAEE